ncbi:MAG: ATP-binding protein [Gordonia polyisoprenivorans]|nr:ATP-binding protein [Gordonia polyisoprenivorans]
MTTSEPDGPVVDATHDVVAMQVPADVVYVSTLRLTAASLATRCDLTVDDIEDLRLAVDEACALLLPHAAAGTSMDARFELASGRLSVRTTVVAGDAAELDTQGFAWTVLGALTDDVGVEQKDGTLAISVTKAREAVQT